MRRSTQQHIYFMNVESSIKLKDSLLTGRQNALFVQLHSEVMGMCRFLPEFAMTTDLTD